ncbi:uncharacterized protein LOC124935381 [Impatiens glandulifera]|uniref:uncharacterized protein LOC124935381 n=1 Tax=Impatiens glandulifera TaxID=253017 RepID=UPI001FB15F88|nr:uncharacterized protein LOC124935381 [Impatiens glandulifera]
MVYLSQLLQQKSQYFVSFPLAIGFFATISVLLTLCAKHARKSKNLPPPFNPSADELMIPPRSPLRFPKQLISSIGDKALPLIYHHHNNRRKSDIKGGEDVEKGMSAATDGGEGLWHKAILMGEKCQPPEFSGAIYYDYEGKRISEMPKSPRANFRVNGIL